VRRVGRRQFLFGGIAGLAVAAFTRMAGAATRFVRPSATPAELLAQYFTDAVGTRRIGDAYVAVVPAESSADALLAALAPEGEDPAQWWASITLEKLQKPMRRRVHDDFEAGDVVDLDGWQLARTEARLAALYVLTQG
jgi:hypothetical protein